MRADNVRAIRNGRKVETRRALPAQLQQTLDALDNEQRGRRRPNVLVPFIQSLIEQGLGYGPVGRVLWLKEAHRFDVVDGESVVVFDDGEMLEVPVDVRMHGKVTPRRSPRYMPKWAARGRVRLTGMWIERVSAVGAAQARREGAPDDVEPTSWFIKLWDELNAKRGFPHVADPWCVVLRLAWVDLEAFADRPGRT